MSGTKYFRNFPKVPYQFGDGQLPINYQDLSVYIDAFDQVREFKSFYQNYQIQNNERPDHVSLRLYGTIDYYWTFFLMNPHLRISGWPMDNSELYAKAQDYYPNVVVVTNGTAFDPDAGNVRAMATSPNFEVGKYVWLAQEKKAVKILRTDQPLASIYLDFKGIPKGLTLLQAISEEDANAINNVDPDYVPTVLDEATIERVVNQFDHVHHYEDDDGNWVYPSFVATGSGDDEVYAFDWSSVSTLQSISYFQRLRETNDNNRSISVLKPDTVVQIVAEFNQLLKRR